MPTKPCLCLLPGWAKPVGCRGFGRRRDGLGGLCSYGFPSFSFPCLPLPLQLWLEEKKEKRSLFLLNTLNEVIVRLLENYICCFNSFLWTLHL